MEHLYGLNLAPVGPAEPKRVNANCTCFSLRKAARAVTQFYDHMLSSVGIRSTQFNLLVSMASSSARTLTDMAALLVMDRTTLTRNLRPLEKAGYVHIIEALDKRSKAYALTEQGKSVVSRAMPLWQSAQEKVQEVAGPEHFKALQEELGHVTKAMSEL